MNRTDYSFGAELEFGDILRERGLLDGCGWDTSDPTMVNSNGIAVDPTGRTYHLGGEVQTRPTQTIDQQVEVFQEVLEHYENTAVVNFRSNLHIHVRVPGLKDNLDLLKRFQQVIHTQFPPILDMLEPIPKPFADQYPIQQSLAGARKRMRRRKRSHHMFIPMKRVKKQLACKSIKDFFALEAPFDKKGNPMWHAQARACVNLRQLLQTDTIEFRHFPGTTNPSEFRDCLIWCAAFVDAVINKVPLVRIWEDVGSNLTIPKFAPYEHHIECSYSRTTHDGTVPKKDIPERIATELRERPKILTICLGNINRSPAAEAILKKKGFDVRSAGFTPKGKHAAKKTQQIMRETGHDLSTHHPKGITDSLCEWADVILVTTKAHHQRLLKKRPSLHKKVHRTHVDIDDPGPMKDQERVRATLMKLYHAVGVFLDSLELVDAAPREGLFASQDL